MRVLLTGGAGFIGQHVHHQLVAEGHEVTILDSFRPDVHAQKPTPRPGLIVGDIRDADCVAQALEGIDTVIHLAAKVGLGVHLDDIDDYVSTNSLGTAQSSGANTAPGMTTGTGAGASADATVETENRMLDKRLKSICRGC